MRYAIGLQCQACISAARTEREPFNINGRTRRENYEAEHGHGALDALRERVAANAAALAKYGIVDQKQPDDDGNGGD